MSRDTFIDSAKGVLIFLVVLGHYFEGVGAWDKGPILKWLVVSVYMFHIPAFVFLAGITAKPTGIAQRVARIALMLIAFQVIYGALLYMQKGKWLVTIPEPYWLLWFLMAMILWNLLIPMFRVVKYPVFVSIILAAAAGDSGWMGYWWSLGRMFNYLPFFVIGHLYGKQIMAAIPRGATAKVIAALLLVGVTSLLVRIGVRNVNLYGAARYRDLGLNLGYGVLALLGVYLVAAVSSVAAFILIPRNSKVIAAIGSGSLAVYLLHGLVIMVGRDNFSYYAWQFGEVGVIAACFVASIIVTWFLSLPVFDSAIRRSTEFVINLATRKATSQQDI
ncbi:acyltransferase family protein [Pseudomonas sp. PSE14]|uniref:acyltransferase family protein n=1 Tax=Pseudomonas sp. PSE14 TaxID=3016341 RepID=UPI0023D867C6|nr:acyltransferase family protein [Pseudomonas sp. PSE14]WEJ74468.1 acyltransferase family protein [Pseudomonas sp. PSE14]